MMISDASKPSLPDAEALRARPRVALIDDDPGVRESFSLNLEDGGFDVVAFEGGPSALAWFARGGTADLILLDINLPDMDGYAVLQCLRESAATRSIPVVGISANAMAGDVERAAAAGFSEYLTKPLDVGQFLAVVDRFLYDPIDSI